MKNNRLNLEKLLIINAVLLGFLIFVLISAFRVKKSDNDYSKNGGVEIYNMDPASKFSIRVDNNKFLFGVDTGEGEFSSVTYVLKYDANKIGIKTTELKNIEGFTVRQREEDSSDGLKLMKLYIFSSDLSRVIYGNKNILELSYEAKSTGNTKVTLLGGDNSKTMATYGGDVATMSQDLELSFNLGGSSTPTPIPVLTPTPTPTATSGSGGGSSNPLSNEGSKPKVEPWCKKTPPSRPTNLQAETTGVSGQVKLTWDKVSEEATHYTVTFGTRWMDFDYGQPNIGNTDQFLVNRLANGTSYYFVITAVNDCASSGYSDGATAYAGWIPGTKTNNNTGGNASNYGSSSNTGTGNEKGTEIEDTDDIIVVDNEDKDEDEATESSDYDYEYNDYSASNDIVFTPEPSLEPFVPDAEDEKTNNLAKALPLIGLVVLALLGLLFIVLTKFAKKDVSNLE